jgi:large subunit ribosomal protein L16
MLQPKRTKYRKMFKGRNDGLSWSGAAVSFGEYGLKATSHGQLTARQVEAARRSISRYVKRGGKLWIRIFPDKPIKPGRVLYEMEGVDEATAREAFRLASAKLSVKTTFVTRTVR